MIVTLANCNSALDRGSPLDMLSEIRTALTNGIETEIIFEDRNELVLCFFPNADRGGISCQGGFTDWTDCSSVEDLLHRWENYDDYWSN